MDHTMRTLDDTGQGTEDQLRFIVEKLFARKHNGRSVRLPKLIECGDIIVYILGQVLITS